MGKGYIDNHYIVGGIAAIGQRPFYVYLQFLWNHNKKRFKE